MNLVNVLYLITLLKGIGACGLFFFKMSYLISSHMAIV